MFRKIFLTHMAVMVPALLTFGILAARHTRGRLLKEMEAGLESLAETIRSAIRAGASPSALQAPLRDISGCSCGRITIIGGDGAVLADSHADPSSMPNHNDQQEVIAARRKGRGLRVHYSDTTHNEMMYLARLLDEANPHGMVVRCSLPLTQVDEQLGDLYRGTAITFIALTVAGAAAAWLLALWISAPLRVIKDVAQAIADGDFSRRAPLRSRDEIGSVALAMNRMTEELSTRMGRLNAERSKLEAVISGMRDGVAAVGPDGTILHANRAAEDLLGLTKNAVGLKIWEAMRLPAVEQAVRWALSGGASTTAKVETGQRAMEAIIDPVSGGQGAVLVARDVTEQANYERLRKEFVANVSHELRTPITLIRGCVETLRDGAFGDREKGPGFLETIEKQILRLGALVDDLLELSHLESGGQILKRKPVAAREFLSKVIEDFRPLAEKKRQSISLAVDPALGTFNADPDFLERAVGNLVDNAVKYSQEGASVTIEAGFEGDWIAIRVRDNGPGIPRVDLPRIFERFYRVDKSRSRELGGTGLGLAIVKHIAQLHGGGATVESEPGAGSVFTIRLPRR